MKGLLFHAGRWHPRQEVAAIGEEKNLLDLLEEKQANDPNTTFWIQDVPDNVVVGSSYYPRGFHPPGDPEWITK